METETQQAEQMAAPVAEMVEQGLRVMRLENETQIMVARQYPRDEGKALTTAIAELERIPSLAASAYYSIPYRDRSGDQEKTVLVEGLSIRAAMTLARRWGNCANAGRIIDETADAVIVQGMFLDYETMVRTLRELRVPRMTWSKRDRAVVPLRADRLNIAVLSGVSKVVRNAILHSLPESLKAEYFRTAKRLVAMPTDEKIGVVIRGLKAELAKRGVSKAQMDGYLKQETLKALTPMDLAVHLRGLLTGLDEGHTSIAAVFGNGDQKAEAKVGSGPVTTTDLLGGPVND